MNRYFAKTLTVSALLLACAHASAAAQTPASGAQQGPNRSTDKPKSGNDQATATLDEAMRLVGFARDQQSPIAMLAAVQMIKTVRVEDAAARVGKKTETAGPEAPAGSRKAAGPAATTDTTALLNEAKAWAKGNAAVTGLIDQELARPVGQGGTLGRPEGAGRHVDRVCAGCTDTYRMTFRGGETAQIAIVGDGDTDLDLYVYDEYGNLIAKDDDRSDRCFAEWTPRWTGNYRIAIKNLGIVYNEYLLLTN